MLLLFDAAANGSRVHRTMFIYGREEMNALNALYKSGEGFGERKVASAHAGEHCPRVQGVCGMGRMSYGVDCWV